MKNYSKILCATDFSTLSKAAAEQATELTRNYDAHLLLLHIVEYFPEDRSNFQIAPEDTDPVAYREQQARAALSEFANQLGLGDAQQEVRFSAHAAKREIVHYAQENNVDLIVIGAHGHHGITALLGSSANGVVNNAPCDVLLVRSKP
ncbi:MAG: universal stress protein [Gammaproteobacteria bacterium]